MPLWSAGEGLLLSSRVVLEVHVGVASLVAPRCGGLVVLILRGVLVMVLRH